MNPLRRLQGLGQSVWYDHIEREMLTSGALENMVNEDGLSGVTSNPAIFEKAISGSSDYDALIASILRDNPARNGRDLFFTLAIEDIREAADMLRPVYEGSQGRDGMVSLEVSPDLAYDTEGTVEEARELWRRLDRPNVMIKVPGTAEGVPAFETLTAEGINVNVTLLFSVDRYVEVADAWLRGLEKRVIQGRPVEHVASVASFFISRVDTVIDRALRNNADPGASALLGQIGIANARLAYSMYQEIFAGGRFAQLQSSGAQTQRLLWASTGTKDPAYSDVLYIDNLIGRDTVNTIPPATYQNFRDHGSVSETLEAGVNQARDQLEALPEYGIDLDAVTEDLEEQGVASFEKAFRNLLSALDRKAHEVIARPQMAAG